VALSWGVTEDAEQAASALWCKRWRSAADLPEKHPRIGLPVGGGLDAVQLGVLAVLGHQLVVAADLKDAGAVEHDDEVGHAHGGNRCDTRMVMRL
jgi:hypothetical protein